MSQISVIVPVYKVEPYLRRCVDSILSQTFQDFELILVDDGSPDNCGAICDEYASKDNRIHVIHQPNEGLSAARNAALDWMSANSPSQYLTFVDSDDWVHDRYLELLYREIDKDNPSISACDFAFVKNSWEMPPSISREIEVLEMSSEKFWCEKFACAASACYKLFSKNLFLNLRFPVGRLFEDQMLMPNLVFQVPLVRHICAPLYFYRVRDDGITHQKWSPSKLDYCDAMEMQMKFFSDIGMDAPRRLAVERFMQQMAIAHYESKTCHGLGRTYANDLRSRALRIMETYGKDVHFSLCAENYAVLSLLHPILFPDFLRKLHHFIMRD